MGKLLPISKKGHRKKINPTKKKYFLDEENEEKEEGEEKENQEDAANSSKTEVVYFYCHSRSQMSLTFGV